MEILNMRDQVDYLKKQESLMLQHTNQNPSSTPPSASTSPTHEFSFAVSVHPNPPPSSTQLEAIDLSPAGDIFFHGHLLPLHQLANLPVSPRSSTNSMDSFTLPMNLLYDQTNPIGNTSFHCHHQTSFSDFDEPEVPTTIQSRSKPKSFSIFGIPKPKKSDGERERDEDQNRERNSKKLKVDLGQLIKRYMKMMKPLLSFPKSRRANTKFNHQSYSYSGNSLDRKPPKLNRMKRGQFSAPASMRNSPANSGILVASGTVSPTKSITNESTMEELHAAIQAAIAHCKNSISTEDKTQSHN